MASTSPPPRRRFLPQPVETTTRSSKRQQIEKPTDNSTPSGSTGAKSDTMVNTTKPRKFLPQPVEETTRSSRKKNAEKEKAPEAADNQLTNSSNAHTHSDDTVHPGYPTSKPSPSARRFAPEPVETTARSSRRKFAVEPIETTSKSRRAKAEEENDTSPSDKPRRKFAPQPVETTTTRRRRADRDDESNESPPASPSESSSRVSSRQSTGSRRFSPELIETAKGSYRHTDKSTPPRSTRHERPVSPALSHTSNGSASPEPEEPQESRFSAAALAKKNHEEHRRHSYCIPNLPVIDSESSSEESEPPSLVDTPSTTDNELHKLAKIEEDNKENYTDYVFNMSNERKRLQEQAMAAYINEVPHQQVAHFGGDSSDEDDLVHVGTLSTEDGADPRTFRRSSQDEHDWEMQNMRKHHEQLEQAKKELYEDTAGVSRFSAAALAARHHLGLPHKPPKTQKQKDEDAEYARMKQAASPPMLGGDIVFPYTVSPKMTRCDVDQAPRPRRADSDDERISFDNAPQKLWSAQSSGPNTPPVGLWMGMCQKPPEQSRPTTPTRSGLQTPAFESPNPFESRTPRGARTPGRALPRPYYGTHLSPFMVSRGSDSNQDEFVSSIDKKLQLEKQIEEEFQPRVVTQIYNYLSLGFPSLARDFDAELSKISRIPMKELRKDDHITKGTIKGYIAAPEAETTWEEDEDGTVRGCKRWEALRLYVKEWARQSPNFTSAHSLPVQQDPSLAHLKSIKADAWGATVRRGSWAQ